MYGFIPWLDHKSVVTEWVIFLTNFCNNFVFGAVVKRGNCSVEKYFLPAGSYHSSKVATSFFETRFFNWEKWQHVLCQKVCDRESVSCCQQRSFRSYLVQRLIDSVIISWLLLDACDAFLLDGWAFLVLTACSYSLWCFECKCEKRFNVFPHRAETSFLQWRHTAFPSSSTFLPFPTRNQKCSNADDLVFDFSRSSQPRQLVPLTAAPCV